MQVRIFLWEEILHKTSHFVPEYNIANNITRRVVVVV